MRSALALLALSCLTLGAQPGPIPIRSVDAFPGGPFIPSSIPGMQYWFVATDLPNNQTITSWTDRISGLVITNGEAATRPTNSSSGLWFNSTFFTNVAFGQAVESLWFILENTDGSTVAATFWQGKTSNNQRMFFDQTHLWSSAYWTYQDAGGNFRALDGGVTLPVNHFMTLLTSLDGTSIFAYTNGVLSHQVGFLSDYLATLKVGSPSTFANPMKCYLKEWAYWTNTLTSANASNLNYYATNTYHYTP